MIVLRPPQPRCLTELEHINRYWDRANAIWVAKILPGEYYVTNQTDEVIATTLGTCISACIRDKVTGIGGMNHFMLPQQNEDWGQEVTDSAIRYGNYVMENLINNILKLGGRRENLEVKLTGGGQISSDMPNVNMKNIKFVLDYLRTENIDVIVQDLGTIFPRKVLYYPSSGRLRVKKLQTMHNETLIQREQVYSNELVQKPLSGSVELF